MAANVDWDQASFTDSSGRVGKPIPSGYVLVPFPIALEGDLLVWDLFGEPKSYRPSQAMLNRFLRLHAAKPEEILKYARQYGVLLLDDDGQPGSHWRSKGLESLERWRSVSRKMCACLNIAAALDRHEVGAAADWHAFDLLVDPAFPKNADPLIAIYMPPGLAGARTAFRRKFSAWVDLARISFGFDFEAKRACWQVEVNYGGRLFAALTLQMMLTVVNADSLYFCSGCAFPYVRTREKRRPRSGQRNFCDECVKFGMPLQFADRDRRQKETKAREMCAAGRTIAEIAVELDAKQASIRRWVKGVKHNAKTKTRER